MRTIVIETFEEFRRRQGCPFIITGRQVSHRTGDDVDRVVFENGAISNGNEHFEPPTGPRQLLTVRREYVKAQLDKEIKDFRAYKNAVLEQAALHRTYSNLPPAPAEAPDLLRAGTQRIERLRQELAVIEEQLIDPAEQRRQEQLAAMESERRAAQAQVIQEIKSIEI